MNQAIDTAAIESLRTFAINYADANTERQSTNRDNLLNFVHMCTAALDGEEWAEERIGNVLSRISWIRSGNIRNTDDEIRIAVIRSTSTTRPDGAIARGFEVA